MPPKPDLVRAQINALVKTNAASPDPATQKELQRTCATYEAFSREVWRPAGSSGRSPTVAGRPSATYCRSAYGGVVPLAMWDGEGAREMDAVFAVVVFNLDDVVGERSLGRLWPWGTRGSGDVVADLKFAR